MAAADYPLSKPACWVLTSSLCSQESPAVITTPALGHKRKPVLPVLSHGWDRLGLSQATLYKTTPGPVRVLLLLQCPPVKLGDFPSSGLGIFFQRYRRIHMIHTHACAHKFSICVCTDTHRCEHTYTHGEERGSHLHPTCRHTCTCTHTHIGTCQRWRVLSLYLTVWLAGRWSAHSGWELPPGVCCRCPVAPAVLRPAPPYPTTFLTICPRTSPRDSC